MAKPTKAKITFISAGAGSGKTYRLTEILREQLLGGQVRPSGVIATTFTRKAAAELRERVRSHLLENGEFQLATAMGQARIGTVNSVCGQLIERFVFESGMAPGQQVLEEAQAAALLARAVDAVIEGPELEAFLGVVRRLGLEIDERTRAVPWKIDLQALVNQIRLNDIPLESVDAFAARNAKDLLSHFPRPTKRDLTAELIAAIDAVIPALELALAEKEQANTRSYLELVRNFRNTLVSGRFAWSGWVKVSKSNPGAKLVDVVEPVARLAGSYAKHRDLQTDISRYLGQMFSIARKALTNYADIKKELGVQDFVDQENLLLGLLDHPEVSAVLANELDLLVVDEFQDTSPIQLALFLKLAGFAKHVYWVGDIKQAIYGFRGSDTALMQSILKELPKLGGKTQVLSSSWRSRPELVRLVNAVFGKAFANSLEKKEVVLQAERKDVLPGPAFANWILGGKNAGEEMSALAGGIGKLVQSKYRVLDKGTQEIRDVRLGDVAVLARSHDRVEAIAAALRDQGIPCATTAQPGLLATPEAVLALACLRRLNDQRDTVATAEIVSLADCVEPEVWLASRLRYLAEKQDDKAWLEKTTGVHMAHPLVARIAALRANMLLLAPREALQTLITACDLPASIVKWSASPETVRARLANLDALLDLATQYEDLCRSGQHAASISGLILWLGEVAGRSQDAMAEPAIDAVRVMTHHAAKGLEWPVVVLLDLATTIKDRLWSVSAVSAGALDVHAPLQNRSIRYWPWPFGAQKKVELADAIAATDEAVAMRAAAIEEEKRLLYVSMTRARDLLVLARSSRATTGEWIDCVAAPWLLPASTATAIALPDKTKLQADYQALAPVAPVAGLQKAGRAGLHWFASPDGFGERLPLNVSPSALSTAGLSVIDEDVVGQRIAVRGSVDMAVLGTAFHACIALSFTDADAPPAVEDVGQILSAFGVAGAMNAADVLGQIHALHDWLARRWPGAAAHAELPVQHVLESGQVLGGRIDLLLDTGDGWILIDHKSNRSGKIDGKALAAEYGGQMQAYGEAIAAVSGKPVLESWLYLPVSAGAVRLA